MPGKGLISNDSQFGGKHHTVLSHSMDMISVQCTKFLAWQTRAVTDFSLMGKVDLSVKVF
jgi:hypothetical protein